MLRSTPFESVRSCRAVSAERAAGCAPRGRFARARAHALSLVRSFASLSRLRSVRLSEHDQLSLSLASSARRSAPFSLASSRHSQGMLFQLMCIWDKCVDSDFRNARATRERQRESVYEEHTHMSISECSGSDVTTTTTAATETTGCTTQRKNDK